MTKPYVLAVTGASATGSIGTITSAGELDDEFGVSASAPIGIFFFKDLKKSITKFLLIIKGIK